MELQAPDEALLPDHQRLSQLTGGTAWRHDSSAETGRVSAVAGR